HLLLLPDLGAAGYGRLAVPGESAQQEDRAAQVLPHPGLPAASDPPRGGGAHLPDGARPGGRAVEPDAVLVLHLRTRLAYGVGMGLAGPGGDVAVVGGRW